MVDIEIWRGRIETIHVSPKFVQFQIIFTYPKHSSSNSEHILREIRSIFVNSPPVFIVWKKGLLTNHCQISQEAETTAVSSSRSPVAECVVKQLASCYDTCPLNRIGFVTDISLVSELGAVKPWQHYKQRLSHRNGQANMAVALYTLVRIYPIPLSDTARPVIIDLSCVPSFLFFESRNSALK
jgi:hypothetical protein